MKQSLFFFSCKKREEREMTHYSNSSSSFFVGCYLRKIRTWYVILKILSWYFLCFFGCNPTTEQGKLIRMWDDPSSHCMSISVVIDVSLLSVIMLFQTYFFLPMINNHRRKDQWESSMSDLQSDKNTRRI